MPSGDRTGPLGQGPMTGRRAGYCSGYQSPGYSNPGFGRRFGFGRGPGRGFRGHGRGFWWQIHRGPYYQPRFLDPVDNVQPSIDEEKNYLNEMIENLEEDIHQIKERLKELSKEK